MADYTVDVLTPATTTDLMSLADAKMWLNINASDTSQDAIVQAMITTFSEEIAERLNRHPTVTIGYEEVNETWRETMNGRLYLSHWPVQQSDVLSVTDNGVVLDPSMYEIATDSGKLSNIMTPGGSMATSWNHPVVVHYWGGYNLPTQTPLPLQHALILLIREERIRMMQAQVAGIRTIRHKEASVAFFDPNLLLLKSLGKSPTLTAIESILTHYMRFQC